MSDTNSNYCGGVSRENPKVVSRPKSDNGFSSALKCNQISKNLLEKVCFNAFVGSSAKSGAFVSSKVTKNASQGKLRFQLRKPKNQ